MSGRIAVLAGVMLSACDAAGPASRIACELTNIAARLELSGEWTAVPREALDPPRLRLDLTATGGQLEGVVSYQPAASDLRFEQAVAGALSPASAAGGPYSFTVTAPAAPGWTIAVDTRGRGPSYAVGRLTGEAHGAPMQAEFSGACRREA